MPITIIGEALLLILNTWKSGDSLLDNIVNVILAFAKVSNVGGSPLIHALYRLGTGAANAVVDMESSGYAIAGADVVNGKTYSVVIVENGTPVAANFGI